ncbi:MAG: pyridoxal phosphate-dependent aminotransferase [Thermoplasmata archaeon]|nr:pyridoxal phosphate-dependent aminotransferase [Thermoplasmata archaeon]
MRFPLADWIDDHADCRYNLGKSGMIGTIQHPHPTLREIRRASASDLVEQLADGVGVDPRRVFLTVGATEANAWVTLFRSRARRGKVPRVRVHFPEYPPLVDVARWAGFRVSGPTVPAELAVVSLPRNPEGILWSDPELEAWTEGARSVLIDETFRPFAGAPSHARAGRPGVWVTGSFTKFYAADDVRVGYVVTPPEERTPFARFHGLVTDELAPYSVAAALRILREGPSLVARVRRRFEMNRSALARALPLPRTPCAPVHFDRVPDGDRLARRCLRASVLVCPGSLFGTRAGVRISLTRRSFPRDLAAYLRVRSREF